MKFRFCGDGDCPDWVLCEIISTLSVTEVDQLDELSKLIAEHITGQDLDESVVKRLTASFPLSGKTVIACIDFLLNSAVRHNVTEMIFIEEIQQLGLPKLHAETMGRVLSIYSDKIRQRLKRKAVTVNELKSVEYLMPSEECINCSQFQLSVSDQMVDGLPTNTNYIVNIDNCHLKVLLGELKNARDVTQKYAFTSKPSNK